MDKYLYPPSDEEIEALALMSPEEVNMQLIELGLDPDAPLPERIKNLIAGQEDQNGGSSVGGTLGYISTEVKNFRLKNNRSQKRLSQSIIQIFQHWAVPVVAAVFIVTCLGLIDLSASIRNQRVSPPNEKPEPRQYVEKPRPALPEVGADVSQDPKTQSPNTRPIGQSIRDYRKSNGKSAKPGGDERIERFDHRGNENYNQL